MQKTVESPFKILRIESKNGMVLIVKKKVVYEVLTRKIESLDRVLAETSD